MEPAEGLTDLVEYLQRNSIMSFEEAARVVQEVLAYFSESLEEFVTRRHRELQEEHVKNEAIFDRITAELQTRRFTAPGLSRRQIRRLVYG